jgi:hypothetical protein
VVDERRSCPHEGITGPQQREIDPRVLAPVFDRGEQLGVETSEASQVLRVHAVVLAVRVVDQPKSPRVGDDHLVPEFLEQPAHPR